MQNYGLHGKGDKCERDNSFTSNRITSYNVCYTKLLRIFLVEALREHGNTVKALVDDEKPTYQIPKILRDIRDNITSITLEDLAEKWNMSENRMNHYLKIEVGYSFHYILMDLRMNKAAEYLVYTKESIEKIMVV